MKRKSLLLLFGGILVACTAGYFTIKNTALKETKFAHFVGIGEAKSKNSTTLPAASPIKKLDKLEYKLIYQSAEKRLSLQNGNQKYSSKDLNEANELICYELRMTHETANDILALDNGMQYAEKIEYFTSIIQNNLKMVLDNDTIPCAMYHFERNFGVAPYLSMQLGFKNPRNNNKIHHLIYNDEYFNFGEIHLENKI